MPPLAGYLSRETGRKIVIEIANSYNSHINNAGSNSVDIAFMGPASYVKMVALYGKKPVLASVESNGKKTFRGVIVVKNESQIASIGDLVGKRFAFGDPESTMSHFVPRYMMLQKGVDVSRLSGYKFLTNHDNIAMSILSGDFHAGALKEDTFLEYKAQGLRSIAVSPDIHDHIFVASSKLSEKTVQALRKALLRVGETDSGRQTLTAIRKDITALIPVADSDYRNLREIITALKKVGVEP